MQTDSDVATPSRCEGLLPSLPEWPIPICAVMRRVVARGYQSADFRADVASGLLVGVIALQHGLYTAIVAGTVVALLGGAKFQVTGPTAAFVIILAPIASKFGVASLLTADVIAGVLLVAMGIYFDSARSFASFRTP